MIVSNDLKAEVGDVWPPAVEHPDAPAPILDPTVNQRKLRIGRVALLSAVTGIGVPAFTLGVLMLLQLPGYRGGFWIEHILSDAWWIVSLFGAACEVTAVVTGILARRTRVGRWGLAIPLFVVAVSVVLILAQRHLNGTWPWDGFSDDCGCDGSG